MNIQTAEFVTSIADPSSPPPDDLPQIAFAGRSNVGKSSLINTILGRTRNRIAKISSTPGKTQTLNYFRINDAFWVVDLPGYGFAKVPRTQRDQWKQLIGRYLSGPWAPRGVVQLIDIRHDPSVEDREMVERLASLGLPTLVVLTKADKLGKERVREAGEKIGAALSVDPAQLLTFSARTGEGREALLESIAGLLEESDP